MKFYSNQVCCGSYACLNAIQDSTIDLSLFEISTGVPFGIRHYEDKNFDRLLTTFCDPNQGLDDALDLWGYDVTTISVSSCQESLDALRSHGPGPAVLGPVNMGGLGYYPNAAMFNRMDHYIVLDYHSDHEIDCIDSEGLFGLRVTREHLEKWINIDGIPEARQRFTLRWICDQRAWNIADVLVSSLRKAACHLRQAEECGQGAEAVRSCCRYLAQNSSFQWRLPFLYDLEYLYQRKCLFQIFLTELQSETLLASKRIDQLRQTVQEQQSLLNTGYRELRWGAGFNEIYLLRFAELEQKLTTYVAQCAEFISG